MPEAFAASRTIESPSCFNVANSTSNPNVSQEFTKNPKNKIPSGGSLDMEVNYLQENFGYKWVNQWSMQKR